MPGRTGCHRLPALLRTPVVSDSDCGCHCEDLQAALVGRGLVCVEMVSRSESIV